MPVVTLMVLSLCSVMAPEAVFCWETLTSAPPKEPPAPFRNKGSAMVIMWLASSSAAPLATTVPPAAVPNALLFDTRMAPSVMVVTPL